jgi:hypothetical protein
MANIESLPWELLQQVPASIEFETFLEKHTEVRRKAEYHKEVKDGKPAEQPHRLFIITEREEGGGGKYHSGYSHSTHPFSPTITPLREDSHLYHVHSP